MVPVGKRDLSSTIGARHAHVRLCECACSMYPSCFAFPCYEAARREAAAPEKGPTMRAYVQCMCTKTACTGGRAPGIARAAARTHMRTYVEGERIGPVLFVHAAKLWPLLRRVLVIKHGNSQWRRSLPGRGRDEAVCGGVQREHKAAILAPILPHGRVREGDRGLYEGHDGLGDGLAENVLWMRVKHGSSAGEW